MKIGELAQATDTAVETIRFYEREQLLHVPARSAGNYRIYGSAHVERLNFIRHCRSLDMALDEIRTLLRLKDTPDKNCGDVNALLEEHIGHVAKRVRELQVLAKQLKLLREQCLLIRGAGECGILKELSSAPSLSRAKSRRSHVHGPHRLGRNA